MRLSLSALRLSIAKHFSPEAAVAFDAALLGRMSHHIDDYIGLTDAGVAILRSVLPAPAEGLENLPLRGVALKFAGVVVNLDAADAAEHPLVRLWAPSTLGGAINQIILAGAALTTVAPGAPLFNSVACRDVAFEPVATATLTFSTHVQTLVHLFYGAEPGPRALATIHDIAGDALYNIGRASVTAPALRHALAQEGLIKGSADAGFASAFVDTQQTSTVH